MTSDKNTQIKGDQSIEFECKICGEKWGNKRSLGQHLRRCGNRDTKKAIVNLFCEFCGKNFDSKIGLGQHVWRCQNNPRISHKANDEKINNKCSNDFVCEFCGKEWKNKISLAQHKIRCPLNTGRISMDHLVLVRKRRGANGHAHYKKSSRVYSEETKEKLRTNFLHKRHSEETKVKISKSRVEYIANNPDKSPWLLSHSSKISFPEKYFIECFSGNEFISFQHPVMSYRLDFANTKTKRYFEVDGEQHYSSEKMINHDAKRTVELNNLGWKGIRIRWSEFQRLTDHERVDKVKEVLDFLLS